MKKWLVILAAALFFGCNNTPEQPDKHRTEDINPPAEETSACTE